MINRTPITASRPFSTIESMEPMILMSASAASIDAAMLDDATAGNDVLLALSPDRLLDGQGGHDVLIGLAGNNVLKGGDGHDMLISVRGDNIIDGGAGHDTVVYWSGNRTDFTVADKGFGIIEISYGSQTDFVTSVEEVTFRDGTFTVSELIRNQQLPVEDSTLGNDPIVEPIDELVTIIDTDTETEDVVELVITDADPEQDTVEVIELEDNDGVDMGDADFSINMGGDLYGQLNNGPGFQYTLSSEPSSGSLNLYGNGEFDFHAAPGFSGLVHFSYTATSPSGQVTTHDCVIEVSGISPEGDDHETPTPDTPTHCPEEPHIYLPPVQYVPEAPCVIPPAPCNPVPPTHFPMIDCDDFDGGSAKGGSAKGGSAKGGSAKGGSAKGGSAKGGSAKGGSAKGGSAKGGSAKGGSVKGGSAKGGSAKGGSAKGGSAKGGSAKGGSAKGYSAKGGYTNYQDCNEESPKGGSAKGGSKKGGSKKGGKR